MILVTGTTGTVGSEVVKRLSAQGRQARALTRDLRKVEADQFPHIEFVQGDFDDGDSLQRACSGVEQAFLLSNSTERAEQQQIGFVEAARKSGEIRFIRPRAVLIRSPLNHRDQSEQTQYSLRGV
jgi:uncharacterized protein YbjT (DUF2867 family)